MINPFIKYVNREKKEDIFHSSAYAKAQNGGSMGVSSGESFNKRREVEKNRQMIKGYGGAGVIGRAMQNGPKAQTYQAPPKSLGNSGKR